MEPIAYTPSALALYETILVIQTGETVPYKGEVCIKVQIIAGGCIFIPTRHAGKLKPLSSLIGNERNVNEVLAILREPTPSRQALLARKNVTQKELANIATGLQNVVRWAKILADIYHRNKNRRRNSQASSDNIVFTNVYDAILEIFLLTFAAYWKVSQKVAVAQLEKQLGRSFALGKE